MAGALVIAAGMAALIATVQHYGAAVTTWDLVPALVAAGLGLGAVIAPLADIVLAGVPQRDAGSASGVFNTGLQLGNSIGIAVIGVIFFAHARQPVRAGRHRGRPAAARRAGAAGVPARDTGRIVTQFRGCLHDRLVAADPTVTPAVLPAQAASGRCRPRRTPCWPARAAPRCGTTSPLVGAHPVVPGGRVRASASC